jgi:hypothetical protein
VTSVIGRLSLSSNLCVPAAEYREQGGFSTAFRTAAAEDRDFCDSWLYRCLPIRVVTDAVVYHGHDLNLVGFWRQHFGYGEGAVLYHARRAIRRREALKVESLSFYTALVVSPFRRERLGRACAISGLLVLSQFASLAGFVTATFQRSVARLRQHGTPGVATL